MNRAALTWSVVPAYAALLVFAAKPGWAQKSLAPSIGSVSSADADVSDPQGALQVVGSRVQLVGSSTVKAHDHTAAIQLARGGSISVCRSSTLHVTAAAVPGVTAPLLLALDRGALEVLMQTVPGDAILTPDLRIATPAGGPLNLKLQVSASGDTCLDNQGSAGPAVAVTDAFGESTYVVKPGQHVLFEHGDLHAVVDRESTPCGCPPATKPGVSIAEALLAAHGTMTPAAAKAVHPFPTAISSGLAEPAPTPAESDGTHVQVATTLKYDPSAPQASAPDADADAESGLAAATPSAERVPAVTALQSPKKNPFRAIGHFFKRIFVR
jgi:hypothetical protein